MGNFCFPGKLVFWKNQLSWRVSWKVKLLGKFLFSWNYWKFLLSRKAFLLGKLVPGEFPATGNFCFPGKLVFWKTQLSWRVSWKVKLLGKFLLSWKVSFLENLALLESKITGNFCFPGKLVFSKILLSWKAKLLEISAFLESQFFLEILAFLESFL